MLVSKKKRIRPATHALRENEIIRASKKLKQCAGRV
jgi:hypothetical protein